MRIIGGIIGGAALAGLPLAATAQSVEDYRLPAPAATPTTRAPGPVDPEGVGQQDFRIPVEQGLATFTALQRKGIESKLLYFPDENHWVLKPHNSVQWHDTVNAWLKQHIGR